MRKSIKKITSRHQHGVSLFIVLVVLLLSLIVVLGGLAVSNLNEALVGNQSDAQRAYGAAQALLDAAERDIRLNGRYCNAADLGSNGTNPTIKVGNADAACTLRYPSDGNGPSDYMTLVNQIGGTGKCGIGSGTFAGVCISGNPANPDFQAGKIIDTQANNGANYLQFIKNGLPAGEQSDYGDTVKAGSTNGVPLTLGSDKGRYWVEIFQYNAMDSQPTTMRVPDGTYPFIFRITAWAQGLRGNTISVLRTYYVPYPLF